MASGGGTSGPLSASAIIAPVVGSGSHILRIEGYSGTKGLGNGVSIASETFTAGGNSWCLRYYPDSPNFFRHSDSVTITLDRKQSDHNVVETTFTISLLDQEGNPVPSYSRTYRHTFSEEKIIYMPGELAGYGSDLIQKSELEKSAYLKDDAFCVRCDVTVVKEIFTKAIPVSEVRRGVVKQDR